MRGAAATRAGGPPVEPEDAEALGAGLRALIADPVLRHRLGEAARAQAQRSYSSEAMVEAYCGIYRELLRGTGARGR